MCFAGGSRLDAHLLKRGLQIYKNGSKKKCADKKKIHPSSQAPARARARSPGPRPGPLRRSMENLNKRLEKSAKKTERNIEKMF